MLHKIIKMKKFNLLISLFAVLMCTLSSCEKNTSINVADNISESYSNFIDESEVGMIASSLSFSETESRGNRKLLKSQSVKKKVESITKVPNTI